MFPVAHLPDGGAGAGALHGVPHEQALATGGRQRVDRVQLALGKF